MRGPAADRPILVRDPQVFYHLGELDDALSYALGAGSLFNVEDDSEYVQTLVGELGELNCGPQRRS